MRSSFPLDTTLTLGFFQLDGQPSNYLFMSRFEDDISILLKY